MAPPRRLYRSQNDRKIAGVLGGLAEYMSVDASILRIAYVVLTALTGFVPGIIVYLLMLVIVPIQPGAAEE
jgi:phage shock protein C